MVSPRWRKVLSDVWANKTRTLLVVLSIAVGVAAAGTMVHMNLIIVRDLAESYAATNPAHATISIATDRYLSTFASFDDDFVESIRRLDGVREAEGRRSIPLRFKHGDQGEWSFILVYALADYDHIRLNKVWPELDYERDPARWPGGAWPPPEREIVIDRASVLIPQMGLSKARLGDMLTVQTPDGHERQVRLAGLAYDFAQEPATLSGAPFGYVTFDTLEWLGGPRGYSELYIQVTGDALDQAHIQRVAERVRDKVEEAGYPIGYTSIPEPGTLPSNNATETISLVLGVLGGLSLFLSSFLVINTISAILAQQVRQIGVMKAVGARSGQIVGLYLALVAVYGLLALIIAMPLGALGARAFILTS
jgi:putative ABC transport system permease protein